MMDDGRRGADGQQRIKPWENCVIALILIGLSPLAPALLELFFKHKIMIDSLTITAVIYAVTIAIASYRAVLFISGFMVALFGCILYGRDITITPVKHPQPATFVAIKIIGVGQSPPYAGLVL